MTWTMRSSVRAALSLVIWGCASVILSTASVAHAQQVEAKLVAVDAIPGRAESLVALESGDVVLLEPVAAQRSARPMTRLVSAGGLYQLDPIIFGNPAWASLKLDHVTQGADQTLWAVGEDSVVYQRPGESWQLIQLPELSRKSCREWGKFGVPCQMIVPVGQDRAVTLRPVMKRGRIGTEVYAVQQGELRALGSVVLPGVALGPVVKDGEGGFWVMLRRTVQTSNFKPMRGYLHYTASGEWKMWSDSGEVVEGTELLGKTKFLIDPNVRKMAPDGQGGFFAVGQDRVLYRVAANGEAAKFSEAQPMCQYCQPLAISYDERVDTLNMVLGEWREGEAGNVEVMGPTRWLEFSAKDGTLLLDEEVPTPLIAETAQREFFSTVVISAAQESKWLSAPGMLLHRSRSGWALLSPPEVLEQRKIEEEIAATEAAKNPAIGQAALLGELGLGTLGVVGSFLRVDQIDTDTTVGGTGYPAWVALPLLSSLAGWYPAIYTVPYLDPARRGEAGRGACLSTGLLGMTALNAGTTLVYGELVSPFTQDDSMIQREKFTPRSVLGAVGGATVGTMSSALLTSLIYQHADKEPNTLVTSLLMTFVSGSISSMTYLWLSPAWQEPTQAAPLDPLMQNNRVRF